MCSVVNVFSVFICSVVNMFSGSLSVYYENHIHNVGCLGTTYLYIADTNTWDHIQLDRCILVPQTLYLF